MVKKLKKSKKNNGKKPAGRKWFDGKNEWEILPKLEQSASVGASLEETLYYADISSTSYYNYLKKHPVFREKIERLKQKPILTARQTVVKALSKDVATAFRFLEKKLPNEFGHGDYSLLSDKQAITIISKKYNVLIQNVKISTPLFEQPDQGDLPRPVQLLLSGEPDSG